MQDLEVFKTESITLSKWLIAIPSVSATDGESVIIDAVHQGVCEFDYFKSHPQHLRLIAGQHGRSEALLALVRPADPAVRDTIIVLCNTDTAGADSYGTFKNTAFKSDELRERLKHAIRDQHKLRELDNPDTIYGLGSYECKCAAGAMVVYLKDCSDKAASLKVNLLVLFTSSRINGHLGIRDSLRSIHELMHEHGLSYRLTVSFAPRTSRSQDNSLPLYTSNFGQADLGFYILGQGADQNNPYSGFSPSLIAALITHKTELNPRVTRDLSKRALIPSFRFMHCNGLRTPNSPDAIQLGFSLPFMNLSLTDLLEQMKAIAAKAIEEADITTDERYAVYSNISKADFEREVRDAEVVSFDDLTYRASRHYRGDLSSAIVALRQKCLSEGMDHRQIARTVIERLNDLAHLPRPSVVVYLGDDFVPQQRLSRNNSSDRELYIKLDKTAEAFRARSGRRIRFCEDYAPTDGNFIRPIGIDAALSILENECPVPVNPFYNLSAPAVTLCLDGGDLYTRTEHFDTANFAVIPAFLDTLAESFGSESEEERNQVAEQEEQVKAVTGDEEPEQAKPDRLPLGAGSTPGSDNAAQAQTQAAGSASPAGKDAASR